MASSPPINFERLRNVVFCSNLQDLIGIALEKEMKQFLLMIYYSGCNWKQHHRSGEVSICLGDAAPSLPLEILKYIVDQDDDYAVISIDNMKECIDKIARLLRSRDSDQGYCTRSKGSPSKRSNENLSTKRRKSDPADSGSKLKKVQSKIFDCLKKHLGVGDNSNIVHNDNCLLLLGVSQEDIDVTAAEDTLKQAFNVDFKISLQSSTSASVLTSGGCWLPLFEGSGIIYDILGPPKRGFGVKFNHEFVKYLLNHQQALVQYLNQFMFSVDSPICYGWRSYDNGQFTLVKSSTLKERFSDAAVSKWLLSDSKRSYIKTDFIVRDDHVDHDVFNLYTRPEMAKCLEDSIWKTCPAIHDYLRRIVANNDQKAFDYIVTWLAKMWKHGQTQKALVLLGSKGIGKSKFIELAGEIVGRNYVRSMNNIHELKNQFNSFLHECVLVGVEEVGDGACKDKATQNTLKALITESHMKVESKHVDSFQAQNNCNFVICSNLNSPVEITEDNRRFIVLALNEEKKQDTEYFSQLIVEMKDSRVIKALRYYLYNMVTLPDCLETLKTEKEQELLIETLSSTERFVRDVLLPNDEYVGIPFKSGYQNYEDWCRENQLSISTDKKFTASLRNYGITTMRKGHNGIYVLIKSKFVE